VKLSKELQSVSEGGWELKALGAVNLFVFERCEEE
jgi:hypothetical protein